MYFKSHFATCLLTVASLLAIAPPANALVMTFSNPSSISIPDSGDANPYPSTISVSGLAGTITKITATVSGISHTFPDDVGAILVGPGGQSTWLFDGAGSGDDISNLTWTFDDDAAGTLPSTGQLVSGMFQPNTYLPNDLFGSPSPAGPYATALSIFDGLNPNGDWWLFVRDFAGGDSGTIGSGWNITITTNVPEPNTLVLLGIAFASLGFSRRRLN